VVGLESSLRVSKLQLARKAAKPMSQTIRLVDIGLPPFD
jgi:hypothetical protein